MTTLFDGAGEAQILALTHGTMVWQSVSLTNANASAPNIVATDLATRTTTRLPITPERNLASVSWPYLLFNQANNQSTGRTSWKLYDLTTGLFTPLPSLAFIASGPDGYTLFWLFLNSATVALPVKLIQIDHIDQSSATSRVLALTDELSTVSVPQVNSRLVIWTVVEFSPSGPHTLYAWDRVQNRLVAFDAKQYMNAPQFVVRDHALMIARNFGGGSGDITVINTDTLSNAAHA